MDVPEITKAITEFASEHQVVVGVVGKEVYDKIISPFIALFVDEYKSRAKERLDRFWEKAAPVMPNPESPLEGIPDRILVPAMQAIAIEDDPTLQDMWVALLAKTASQQADIDKEAQTVFVSILQQMSGDQAIALKNINMLTDTDRIGVHQLATVEYKIGWSIENRTSRIRFSSRFLATVEGLEHLLLVRRVFQASHDRDTDDLPFIFQITARGDLFLKAVKH